MVVVTMAAAGARGPCILRRGHFLVYCVWVLCLEFWQCRVGTQEKLLPLLSVARGGYYLPACSPNTTTTATTTTGATTRHQHHYWKVWLVGGGAEEGWVGGGFRREARGRGRTPPLWFLWIPLLKLECRHVTMWQGAGWGDDGGVSTTDALEKGTSLVTRV